MANQSAMPPTSDASVMLRKNKVQKLGWGIDSGCEQHRGEQQQPGREQGAAAALNDRRSSVSEVAIRRSLQPLHFEVASNP